MKYLKVAGPGRPKAEGRHHQETRRGEEGRSLIRCVLPFWSSSLRSDICLLVVVVRWFLILVYWVRFSSLGQVSFFLSFNIYQCLVALSVGFRFQYIGFWFWFWFWFFFFFFFFLRICGFATICNLLGLLCLIFFLFQLGLLYHLLFRIDVWLFSLVALFCYNFFFFFQILVQNFFGGFFLLVSRINK